MTKRTRQRIYHFEQFRLDAAHSMLYRNDEQVSLPPKAIETLQALVERNGHIVGKNELMRIIWNDSIVEESNLSLYLHLLRKTLGERADNKPFIETLRRRGYRFSADVRCAGARPEKPSEEFIGREDEVAELTRLLVQEGVRLVTLTGVGGVGKTTLAQAVQARVNDQFRDGAFFIELASVNRPEQVAPAIATALGVRTSGNSSTVEALKNYLGPRELLLILDNFEQLIPGATQISDLLNSAPDLKIIVTSRVHLRLSVDHEFIVPPLAVPSAQFFTHSETLGELSSFPAVQLFITRAQNANPGFVLTHENASEIAEICRRLHGLPLAIELAAARTKLMSPEAILARLKNQLTLLTGGPRDMPVRQQTMRGTIQWSYDLLDEEQKHLFACLAVFVGGFTLAAAEAVCGWENNIEPFAVLDGVTSLTEHNLLVTKDQPDGDSRFQMLEVVREFALQALRQSGESHSVNRRHAEYFCSLGEVAEPQLQAAQSADWLSQLEADHDNLRAALSWAAERDPALGQRLAGAIWRFWWLHGHISEACDRLGLFLSLSPAEDKARLKMLSGAAQLSRLMGNRELARSYSEEELLLARSTGDKKNAALSLQRLGFLRLDDEKIAEAKPLLEEGLQFALEVGDKQVLGMLYNGLGELSRLQEEFAQATEYYIKALEFNREAGDRVRQTTNLINLGATALAQNDLPTAASYYREGLTIASKMDDMNGTLYCLEGIAGSYWAVKKPQVAAQLFGATEALRNSNNLFIEPADRLLYERSVARVREALTEKDFSKLVSEGSRMKMEEVVALALSG
ncbi:MAG TPA: winged helix-turn-helix domain-containing protein [Pyrinomonadaceae bacterium]